MLKLEVFCSITFKDNKSLIEDICKRCTHMDTRVAKALAEKDTNYEEVNNIIMYKGLVYIPGDTKLQERIIAAHHDMALAGHPGCSLTAKYITQMYWWPLLQGQVTQYCAGCIEYQSKKSQTKMTAAPLNPPKVAPKLWHHISVDFIRPLNKLRGYCMIMW